MTTERAKEIAERYQKVLRDMKRYGVETEDAPPDVQAAFLALHQHAQLYWMYERRADRLLSWEEWKDVRGKSS